MVRSRLLDWRLLVTDIYYEKKQGKNVCLQTSTSNGNHTNVLVTQKIVAFAGSRVSFLKKLLLVQKTAQSLFSSYKQRVLT